MVFSSIIFLTYFLPIVLLLYIILPYKYKNTFLLLVSVFFYSWGAPRFIFVILLTTTIDFYIVGRMAKSSNLRLRNTLLISSLFLNFGLLFYFKYCNFFIENVNFLLGNFGAGEITWMKVVLPIGISFYTFESVTYMIDVYRKEHKPLDNFLNYQLYILLFPKLIAGPIIRYKEIAEQITDRTSQINLDNFLYGFYRFSLGLAKKVILANNVGVVADYVFNANVSTLSTLDCWMGALCYTFQIYFDFSGYSDMAIGLGRMFGFIFPENFENPYISKSVTEFWKRWHITLSNWMRNYIYIPLGGNRVKKSSRLYFNLWFVFILSGFWHGASWTFIVWGAYYGFWLIIERITKYYQIKFFKFISLVTTFVIVVIGWVIFRAESLQIAGKIISHMVIPFKSGISHPIYQKQFMAYLIICSLFSFFVLLPFGKALQKVFYSPIVKPASIHISLLIISFAVFLLSMAMITTTNYNPFIYFRF
ncbi:MAG: MBOAT family protein [Sphingobacteriaceae bacterium]|nr:MBOAT family protein [Sphingobacteriaceae bacterium]